MKEQDSRHNLVKQHIQNGKPILDVGGGKWANIGLYVPNYTVTVNENSDYKPDLVWDGCDLPFKDKAFPNVVSIETIHLVLDKAKFRSELKRVASERVVIYDCGLLEVFDVA